MLSLAAVDSASGSSTTSLLILALPVLLIAFMFITQRRRAKEAQRLQSELNVGDEVTTTSGLLGKITALDDDVASLEVSRGVVLRFNRRAIAGPTPFASTSSQSSASSKSKAAGKSDPTSLSKPDPTSLSD